jgi:hypothetical protein
MAVFGPECNSAPRCCWQAGPIPIVVAGVGFGNSFRVLPMVEQTPSTYPN